MSGPKKIVPPRALVERIVREEAEAQSVPLVDVLGGSHRNEARVARTRAMVRIMSETGCSHVGLEEVWGSRLRRLARRHPNPQRPDTTLARLTWQHGPEAAAAIMAGRDELTNQDVAAWRRLTRAAR